MRGDFRTALALGASCLALYSITACRTVYGGDSGEFTIVFATGGVAHPPGYPLLTLLSIPLTRALFFASPAWAANLLSGLWGAMAVSLAYLCSRRFGRSMLASALAAMTLAVGRTFWSQCVVAEAYSFDLLLLLAVLLVTTYAAERASSSRFALLGLAVGLWLGHRNVNVLFVPAILLVYFGMRRARTEGVGVWLWAVLGGALSGLVFLYLFFASAGHPPLNYGFIRTLDDFLGHVSGRGFAHLLNRSDGREWLRLKLFASALPVDATLALPFVLFAGVKLFRSGHEGAPSFRVWAKQHSIGLGLLLLLATNLTFAVRYEIPDIEVYFLPSYLVLCLLSAKGVDLALASAPRVRQIAGIGALIVAASSALALGAVLSWKVNDLSDDPYLQNLGEDTLSSLEDRGILFVQGDTVANTLYYLQVCEHRAPGAAIVYAPLEQHWYREHLTLMYPEVKWPDLRDDEPWEARTVRIIEANIDARPIYFSTELSPAAVLQRGRKAVREPLELVILQKGLVKEVRAKGRPYDPAVYAERNVAALEAAAARVRGMPMHVDIDTKISYLQYAYALNEAGAMLEARRADLAERAYRAALSLDPAPYEQSYRDEQGWRMGETIQNLGIQSAALAGLERLRARAAAGR